ncbi:hypothetical protein LPJ70_000270, partial [Coemansia sp. RSA 2708]
PGARDAWLALTANSVRRAAWDAVLGFQRAALAVPLAAVDAGGGAVGATLDVVVARRYPPLFMETLGAARLVRCAREEERVALAHAARGLPPRRVAPLFRMRVCDYRGGARLAAVTVWRACDEYAPREGARLRIAGATPTRFGAMPGELGLSVGRAARMRPAAADAHALARSAYRARRVLRVDDLPRVVGAEVDVTGAVAAHTRGAGAQLSVLRLRGAAACVDIEYASAVFGCVAAAVGDCVTVRSCRVAAAAPAVRLRADECSEFVV